jgi:CheY-like chemotaxis protein
MSDDAKILVVDDVPQNVRLLEAVLAPRGYDVVTATDGESALRLVESSEASWGNRSSTEEPASYLPFRSWAPGDSNPEPAD